MNNDHDAIPYLTIKFSNGDDVLCELISETPFSMNVRNLIQFKKVFVTNEKGLKVQKTYSLAYAGLALGNEAQIQKSSCNFVALLKYDAIPHYEMLVEHHIKNQKPVVQSDFDSEEDFESIEVPKDKLKIN